MSSFLYRLGRRTTAHARVVVALWLLVLLGVGALAGVFGGQLQDDLTIPGTEAQDGLDVLKTRFPEVSGTSAQVVFTAPQGTKIAAYRAQVHQRLDALEHVDHVLLTTDPFGPKNRALSISDDRRHALAQVQLDIPLEKVQPDLVDRIERTANDVPRGPDGSAPMRVDLGGQMFTKHGMSVSATEGIGLGVALVVLVLTLGSLLAAGIPLLTAVLGVGITMSGVIVTASMVSINTSTPSLAMMIGLAVGIDYALFLVARHRAQLGEGMAVEESVARSVATAGSAVIFAGVTVMIALCGLVVARIPFLSVMGLAAAVAVAVAVAIAVTLVPAVLSIAGERLRPKARRARRPRRTPGTVWVSLVTRVPALTAIVVVAGLLALAAPALDLRLGLPDNGSAESGSPERVTYDLVEREYGAGFNSPLLVTADIVRTRDPVGVMKRIGHDIEGIDGVDAVALTTPNRTADLGIVQVIPEHAQTDPRTADLVRAIRDRADQIEKKYDVTDVMVTGQTAVTIDVSDRLGGALLPFGVVVVGLSLLLLMVVFRSVAVPLKATAGYLLSVAASFGAVVLVFQDGWLADTLNVERPGPVLSFLPIMLMGVLFGLAMDYEVFLVSRMREHWVHHGEAHAAIREGFSASARVVTAAALIMVAVFASFVPEGDSSVKPMAFGLAVGVLVDAFLVRMTLVPAVMALLGERAWRLPRWLDRRLPSIDVEGEGLAAHLEHEAWVGEHGEAVVRVDGLRVDGSGGSPLLDGVGFVVRPGELALLTGDPVAGRALLAVLAGRLQPQRGTVAVLDRLLPSESGAVRSRVAPCDHVPPTAVRRTPELLLLDVDALSAADAGRIREHLRAGTAVVLACRTDVNGLDPAATVDLAPATRPTADREEALL